jgi:hypothetical protein
MNVEQLSRALTHGIMQFHADAIEIGKSDQNDERFQAAVVKCIALCTLAYGIPAVADEEPDFDEAMLKLAWANDVLLPQNEE